MAEGLFDDLIPEQRRPVLGDAPAAAVPVGAGLFDDLVPRPRVPNQPAAVVPVVDSPEPLGTVAVGPTQSVPMNEPLVLEGVAPEAPSLGESLSRRAQAGIEGMIGGGLRFLGETFAPVRPTSPLVEEAVSRVLPYRAGTVLGDVGADVVDVAAATRASAMSGERPDSIMDVLSDPTDALRYYGGILAESTPSILAALATRNPQAATALTGALTGVQSYGDVRDQGVAIPQAIVQGVEQGVLEAGGAQAPFAEAFSGAPLATRLARTTGAEVLGEVATAAGQNVAERTARGEDVPLGELLGDILDAAIVSAPMGAIEALGGRGPGTAQAAAPRSEAPSITTEAPSSPLGAAMPLPVDTPRTPAAEALDDLDALLESLPQAAQVPEPDVLGGPVPSPAASRPEPPTGVPRQGREAAATYSAPVRPEPIPAVASQEPELAVPDRPTGQAAEVAEEVQPEPEAAPRALPSVATDDIAITSPEIIDRDIGGRRIKELARTRNIVDRVAQAGGRAGDLMRGIAEQPGVSDDQRLLASKLAPIMDDLGIRLVEAPEGASHAGAYNNIDNTIYVQQAVPSVALHESLHAATSALLTNPRAADYPEVRQARSEFEQLLSELQGHVREARDVPAAVRQLVADPLGPLSNTKELLTYGFTDKGFQQYLQTLPAPRGIQARNLWEAFKSAVAKLLGRLTPRERTFLDQVIESGGALVDFAEANPEATREAQAAESERLQAARLRVEMAESPQAVDVASIDETAIDASRMTPAAAEAAAEVRRNDLSQTLPSGRGTIGWNYDDSAWVGRKGAASNARVRLQDKMLAWRDVQNQIESQVGQAIPDTANVYRLENLMHGRVSTGIDRIENSQVEPLMEAMRKAGVSQATLEEYLYARHAEERNRDIAAKNPAMPDGGSGMTTAEAQSILAGADKAKLEPLARRVDAIVQSTRQRLLDAGLITQQAFDAMSAQYTTYVPLRGKRVAETDFQPSGGGAGRGIDTRRNAVREALGRGAGNRADNILAEVIGDAQRSVILAEKARVGRAVLRLVLANPNPALWQVEPVQTERRTDANGEVYEAVVHDWSDPSIIAVKHRGQTYKVQINNVPLAQALSNVGIDQLGAVTRAAGAVNRYLSAMLTKYNPAFVPVNATRDAIFGMTGMAAEKGELAALDAAIHYPQAALAAFRHAANKSGSGQWDRWATEFADAGGRTGYVNAPSVEDLSRAIGKGAMSNYTPEGVKRAAKAIGDVVEVMNDTVENALRLSAYVTLRKRGESVEAAAEYAKNLTVNFNRKGYDGSRLNAWFLFYNAGIQGAKRAVDVMRKPKTWAYLGSMAAIQTIATMYAMGLEDDDGEPLWNKVPDHVKRRNIVLVLSDETVLTIPMPYGFNVFTYMAGRIPAALTDRDTKRSNQAATVASDILSTATESFFPVPVGDGAMGLLPTVLRVPANIQVNRDDFGREIRRENMGKYDVPRASMGRPDTLELFKLAAQGMNRVGGGDKYTPPNLTWFDIAPEDMEYLLGEVTGGAGKFVMDVASVGQNLAGGDMTPAIKPKEIPIAGRFVQSIDQEASTQALFYERRDAINRSLERVRDLYKEDPAAAEALLKATPELKGAAFKRRKKDSDNGAAGSVIENNGRPVVIVDDPKAVFGQYKAAEEAVSDRNEAMRDAYTRTPAALFPTDATRLRDANVRTQNAQRQLAQRAFNSAWARDVVGKAE